MSAAPQLPRRAWGDLRGKTYEHNEVAKILREQLTRANLTLDRLADRIPWDGKSAGRTRPSIATLSKRFAGEGLANNSWFVHEVIRACAPDDADALIKRVEELYARGRAQQVAYGPGAMSDPGPVIGAAPGIAEEVSRLREELDRERERRHRSELTSMLLIGLLAARPGDPAHTGATPSAPETAVPPIAASNRVDSGPPVRQEEPAVPPVRPAADDKEVQRVVGWLRHHDPDGSRLAASLRSAIDAILDGPGTGRYSVRQLDKYERTHLGHRVRRALQHDFRLPDGDSLELSIAGVDVEVRFTLQGNGWMIRPDTVGRIVLLVSADEARGVCSFGVCRVRPDMLRGRKNRDGADMLRREALDEDVTWLLSRAPLPGNVLLRLGPEDLQAIFTKPTGSQRVTELARRARGGIVERRAFSAAAMQLDFMKRVRDLRRSLAPEGLEVLSGRNAAESQRALDLGYRLGPDDFLITEAAPSSGADAEGVNQAAE